MQLSGTLFGVVGPTSPLPVTAVVIPIGDLLQETGGDLGGRAMVAVEEATSGKTKGVFPYAD
jgi:hypothetical protein